MAAVCLDCFESLKNQFVEVSSHNSSTAFCGGGRGRR